MVNLLPLEPGETISTIMPMPEDEAQWANMQIIFSTSSGQVRRNALSDFTNIRSNGKIAMKLEETERLIAVSSCDETNDIMLTTREGRCIRFDVTDVREFVGRTSTGVRGIRLEKGDEVVSMTLLHKVDFTIEERIPTSGKRHVCAVRMRKRNWARTKYPFPLNDWKKWRPLKTLFLRSVKTASESGPLLINIVVQIEAEKELRLWM
jgi:DNA gyrase/topoisomerase IV subunit A